MRIPITKPYIGKKEIYQISKVIQSGWVTQGPEVEAFENEFKIFVNAKYAVAVSSCTTGLHLALKAVGVKENDEVITVSQSFIATANSIRFCGAVPVFVDVEPGTYNLDPELIERVISKKTKAILCVHQIGMPCDINRIVKISKKYKIPLIEDAACAIGSEIKYNKKWEKIGKPHGDIACFSFHPRKIITTGDGGMITTNNAEFAKMIRLWRHHSMSVSDKKRHSSKNIIFEEYLELGYNFRMTDIQAAMGRAQLRRLRKIISKRRDLAEHYFDLFKDNERINLPYEPDWAKSNWQSFCIRLSSELNQKKIMQKLLDMGIATKRGIMCAHLEPAYMNEPWHTGNSIQDSGKLVESHTARDSTILIPFFPQLKKREQRYIAEQIIQVTKDKNNC